MKKKYGVTLVEILIAAGLMAVILAIVIPYVQDTKKQAAMSSMMGTLRQEAQLALRSFEKDISAARVIKMEEIDKSEIYENTLQYKPVLKFEGDENNPKLTLTTSKEEISEEDSSEMLMFDSEDDDIKNYVEVVYSIDKDSRNLMRDVYSLEQDSSTHKPKRKNKEQTTRVAKHIKTFNQITDDEASKDEGKIGITVTFSEEVPITHKIATHTESLLVSVRQLQAKIETHKSENYDSRHNKRWRQKND